MEKAFADKMILRYKEKLFGFALAKTNSTEEAEELASRIVLEVYASLLCAREVDNWNAYIYRIAHNVYVRYVNECIRHRHVSMDGMILASEEDFTRELMQSETIQLVKREIAYLGKIHRQIVVKHYYERKSVKQIAKELHLPEGTVKWYLYDARKTIGKGMKKMREKGNLGLNPIQLVGLGHDGTPGTKGATEAYLNSTIRQNIVYAAYYEDKTLSELAEELGISPVFLEDEVAELADNGFLARRPGGKYSSNVVISDIYDNEVEKRVRDYKEELIRSICKEYLPEVKKQVENYDRDKIYVPQADSNFLLWSVLMCVAHARTHIADSEAEGYEAVWNRHCIKPLDGGNYVAMATVYREQKPSAEEELYWNGYMTRNTPGGEPLCGLQVSSSFDTREKGWEDNEESDYADFYWYLTGRLPKEEALAERYKRLYDRGFLWNEKGQDEINMVLLQTENRVGPGHFWQGEIVSILSGLMPELPGELKDKIQDTVEKIFECYKPFLPKRFHDYVKIARCGDVVGVAELLKCALEEGILQPLTERQKKGVMTMIAVEKSVVDSHLQ